METSPHVTSPAQSLPPLPSSPFSSTPSPLPLPHLMQWNSSSLSAMAPPFTLDHASSALHSPLQMPPCTPHPLLFGDFPTSARLPPHNEVATSLPPLSDRSRSPPGGSDFADCFRNAELRAKALGNTVEPTIYSGLAAPSGARSDAATLVEPFYSLYYPDSQQWSFKPFSAYYNHRTSELIDGKVSPAKRSDEVPLTEVSRPPLGYTAPSSLQDRPSSSQLPPHDTTADSLPSGSINDPFGHPCYAHYYNDSELRSLDDNFGPSSAHSKLGVAQWNKPSDEDVASVKLPDELPGTGPPSSSRKLFFPGGKEHFGCQSTEWLLDDQPPEKYEREHDSASSYTSFNPQLSTSAMGLNDIFSDSAYDRYMTQLDSCSVYPEFFYPFANWSVWSQLNEAYLPSNFTASANINPSLSSGKVHHEVLHMVADASVIPSGSKEANLNESMDPKGEHNEKRWEDYHTTSSNVLPAVSRRDFPSSNNHATESSLNLLSMLTSKLTPGNMVIDDSSPSACNTSDLNVSSMSSSEAFDQHNLSVDSPCWKGAPASQQSLFTSDRMLFVERELVKNHSCHEPNNSAEQVGNMNFDYVEKSHVSEKPECSPVVSSIMQQILEFSENKMSDRRKDQENEISFDYVHEEQTNQTTEAKKRVDAQHVFAAKFVEKESDAPNEFPPPKDIAKNIKDPSSAPLRKLEELVKLIHGSSVELLSTNCSEAEGLKPHDCKLLYAAISNISLLLKDEDIVGCSGLETACSENMSSRNQNYDTKRKTISGCDYFDDDFGNLVIQGGDAHVSKVGKKMMQTFENALSRSFTEIEESKQASLYKNLWVQAELLACRLKQELVIAQMKIESESHPPQSDMSSSLNSLHSLKVHDSPLKPKDTESIREKENQASASANYESSKAEDLESSVIARFEILKDRNNKSIHRDVEVEDILDQEHAAMHLDVNARTANLANMGFIAAVANDQASPSLDVSGYGNTRQTLSGPLDGPLIQSYVTCKQGSCPSRSRDEDLSFEWVHVMGEDESTQ